MYLVLRFIEGFIWKLIVIEKIYVVVFVVDGSILDFFLKKVFINLLVMKSFVVDRGIKKLWFFCKLILIYVL